MRDLAGGPRRFVELQRVLPGISTEQLRSRLNRMVADGLLTRQRYREVPPRVDYELTSRAHDLLPVLGALARWGYEWAWTAPRDGEAIDIGAILRIAPGLVNPPPTLKGVAELTVVQSEGATRRYALSVADGDVQISETDASGADVRVSGSETDWVEALGPECDRARLRIDGDERLARMLLDGLTTVAERSSQAA